MLAVKNILLIGMPGSGKSSVAKIFAQNFSYNLIDTDDEIEKAANKNISAIFNEYGEKYFRQCEHNVIKKIAANQKFIIALGGGCITFKKNLPLIKNLGRVVYLFCRPNQIYKNLDYAHPLVKKNLSNIKFLYQKRYQIYLNCCDYVLNCNNLSLDLIAEKLFTVK